jgi:hypothetical protein
VSLRRVIYACLLAVLGTLAVGMSTAVAGPRDVIADWYVDGAIDGTYTLAELRGALNEPTVVDGGGAYDAFRDLVNAEITARVVGGKDSTPGSSSRSAPPDKGPAPREQPGGLDGQAENPGTTPPEAPLGDPPAPPATVGQDEDLPTAFIALAAVAGLLVVVGGGTALARRLRRR